MENLREYVRGSGLCPGLFGLGYTGIGEIHRFWRKFVDIEKNEIPYEFGTFQPCEECREYLKLLEEDENENTI